MTEKYTPGQTQNTSDFMARRSLESHGAFFFPFLEDRMVVLDCGCGPGTITCDIAQLLPAGRAVGVDADASQVRRARACATGRSLRNVEFHEGSAYDIPYPSDSFNAVFSHALLEHLSEPAKAVAEFYHILEPGGAVGICSPDWGGFLPAPPSEELTAAIESYRALQTRNGGDVYIGRKFSRLLRDAGFDELEMQARYEVY